MEDLQKARGRLDDMESQLNELNERLEDEEDNNAEITALKNKLEDEIEDLKQEANELGNALDKVCLISLQADLFSNFKRSSLVNMYLLNLCLFQAEQEKAAKQQDIERLNDEIAKQDSALEKLSKEKRSLEDERNVSYSFSLMNVSAANFSSPKLCSLFTMACICVKGI